MKKIIFVMVLFLSLAISGFGQDVTIPLEDLKQLRSIAADREFQKKRADEAERQSKGWQESSEKWAKLYEDEKKRADVTQGGRIDELKSQVNELGKANFQYKEQAQADRTKIGELEFDARKYKGQRKWYFAAGAGTGATIGGLTGYKACRIF